MEMTNPYQTPAGNLTTETDEPGTIKFFSPSCRIGRVRYLSHSMLVTLASYLVIVPMALLMATAPDMAVVFIGVLGLAYVAVMAVFIIIVIQRLHDLNQSGWFSLLLLVPLVNLFLAIYLLFWPGSEGRNNYGGHPPANRWWHWTLGLLMPALFMVGIMAAVAIPAYQDYVQRVQAMQQDAP